MTSQEVLEEIRKNAVSDRQQLQKFLEEAMINGLISPEDVVRCFDAKTRIQAQLVEMAKIKVKSEFTDKFEKRQHTNVYDEIGDAYVDNEPEEIEEDLS